MHTLPNTTFARRLGEIVGAGAVLSEPAETWVYGYDNSRRHHPPDYVAFATEATQIQEIVRLCLRHEVPLVARGRATGTTGGSVPVRGGVVLSLERMDRILRLDPLDRLAVVEPGVTNQALQDAAAEHGFFWPPDPTSAAYCTVGGNLGYNSAGPRAVKYGTPRENTLGLRAVTGTGELIRTGVCTTKGVVGYDLTRLLIGSEGTLAIITDATLKLTPLPQDKRTLRAVYVDIGTAAQAVSRIMSQPVIPCALEIIDGNAMEMIRSYAASDLPSGAGALLMIEVDGPRACLDEAVASISTAARGEGLVELVAASSAQEVADLWATRKALSPALRNVAPKKINEDVVVPVSRMPELIGGLDRLSSETGITIINFGHAGNGNIHVNLLVDPDDAAQMVAAADCLRRVFSMVLELGGTLSGEHGVGTEKRDFVGREIDPVTLDLMRRIKAQFDPKGILNPSKLFPSA